MNGARRRGVAAGWACLGLLWIAGCGDPVLWARWRAERAFWHAQRDVERVLVKPRVASPRDYARAEAAFRAIIVEFPAARWARAGAAGMELDVAKVSGRSALELAHLAELQSRSDEAVAGYARVETDWGALGELALEAAMLKASALENLGQFDAALHAWQHVARDYDALDPASGAPRPAHLQAMRRLASGLKISRRSPARDSLLRSLEGRFVRALAPRRGGAAAAELADAVAECRELRGDLDGAFDARRSVLAMTPPVGEAERARRVLGMGEGFLDAGRPDSALAYARRVSRDYSGPLQLTALQLEARAQRSAGRADSALAAWSRILNDFPRQEDAAAEARFQRALLLQSLNRWALARAEFSALCATYPAHPRALEAWERVVRHLRASGEPEMARIETEHALGAIDQLTSMQHDSAERGRTVEARVAVLLAAGRNAEGIRDLQGLWSAVGMSENGARLGEAAATAAESQLGDRALARRLWQILGRSAPDPRLRERAAGALERLGS
ncbi:MAG: tetratricopeptide repeat protein [Candidatus Eisenbacteria bacterium]